MLNSYAWTYSGDSTVASPSSLAPWSPTGGLMPVHDTTGVTDALMSGGLAGLDLLTSCTSIDGTANYSYDPTGQLIGATYTGGQSDEAYTVRRQRQPNERRLRDRGRQSAAVRWHVLVCL